MKKASVSRGIIALTVVMFLVLYGAGLYMLGHANGSNSRVDSAAYLDADNTEGTEEYGVLLDEDAINSDEEGEELLGQMVIPDFDRDRDVYEQPTGMHIAGGRSLNIATITGFMWKGDPEIPDFLTPLTDDMPVILLIEEWIQGCGVNQLQDFLRESGRYFRFISKGNPTVRMKIAGYFGDCNGEFKGFYLEYVPVTTRLIPGVSYTVVPEPNWFVTDYYGWNFSDDLRLVMPEGQ